MKQLLTLSFFSHYPGWHSFDKSLTKQVKKLLGLGFLELNEFNQAKFTGKTME